MEVIFWAEVVFLSNHFKLAGINETVCGQLYLSFCSALVHSSQLSRPLVVRPWKNAAYSIFNLFLVPGLALALFQSGYNA